MLSDLKQRAAEPHLVLHAELGELLHAIDLGQAAHVVEQNVRLEGLGLDQSGGEIGVVDRQHVAVIGTAGFLERLDEGVLQRVAVGVIGRDEEPFLAELLDQFRRDRLGVHRCRVADAEHVPFAIGAGDRIGMTAGDDMEHLLFVGHLRHGVGDAGVDVADDGVDLIAVDQLARLLHAGADVVRRILDEQLDLAAENSALLVDLGLGVFGAVNLALRQRRQHAGQRIDHADLHRLIAERLDDERCADGLTGAECKACLEQGATAYGQCGIRHNRPSLM